MPEQVDISTLFIALRFGFNAVLRGLKVCQVTFVRAPDDQTPHLIGVFDSSRLAIAGSSKLLQTHRVSNVKRSKWLTLLGTIVTVDE